MEYEIDELSGTFWSDQGADAYQANHMPAWYADSAGQSQTGEWIPEEASTPLSRTLAPAE